mmetsp:Transcript_31050/g.66697  ORF Transcript_31050/g.66697 Transcript_31050/m.66697 type:complete len:349 (+) Transcript_31050:419-1465(+)
MAALKSSAAAGKRLLPCTCTQAKPMSSKASSPKTHSSSLSPSSSGKAPLERRKAKAAAMAESLSLSGNLPASASAATTASITLPPLGDSASAAALVTFPPTAATTESVHSVMSTLAALSAGTYATMASCLTPAEKTILPTWPEQPLRSSAPSSGMAFIAVIEICSSSTSPSGDSMVVQKKSSPPMSEAPSISTPFFPPSLTTFLSSLSFSFAAFSAAAAAAAAGSSFFSSFLASSFFAFSFFSFFDGVAAAGAGAGAGAGADVFAVAGGGAIVSGVPGSDATLAAEKDAMCVCQRRACGKAAAGFGMALNKEMSFCVGMLPSTYEAFSMNASSAATSVRADMLFWRRG